MGVTPMNLALPPPPPSPPPPPPPHHCHRLNNCMKQKAFSPGLHSSSLCKQYNRTRKSANKEAVYKGLLRIGSNVYIYSFGPWRGVHLLLWTMERCTFTPLDHGEVYIYSFGPWRGVHLLIWTMERCTFTHLDHGEVYIYSFGPWRGVHLLLWNMERCTFTPLEHGEVYIYSFGTGRGVHLLLWNMERCTFTPLEHGEVYIYSIGTWKGSTLCIACSYLHQVRQTVGSSKSLTCHVGYQNQVVKWKSGQLK